MDSQLQTVADSILAGVKTQLGSEWAKLDANAQALIVSVSDDASLLAIQAAGVNADPDSILEEQKQISAQLANIEAASEVGVLNTFWTVAAQVLTKAVSVATTALIASA